jgi:hypothetical protein
MGRKKKHDPKPKSDPKDDAKLTDKQAIESLFPAPVVDAVRETIKSNQEKQNDSMAQS